PFAAATNSAPSVGSPRTAQVPPSSRSLAPLQSTDAINSSLRARRPAIGDGGRSGSRISPVGRYPSPVTSKSRPPAKSRVTVISFFVIVPVLSEQITVADP